MLIIHDLLCAQKYQIIDKLLSFDCLRNTKERRERNEATDLENKKYGHLGELGDLW